jgi:hypothetical protein
MFTTGNASSNGLALTRSINPFIKDEPFKNLRSALFMPWPDLMFLFFFFSDMPNLQHRGIWRGIKALKHQLAKLFRIQSFVIHQFSFFLFCTFFFGDGGLRTTLGSSFFIQVLLCRKTIYFGFLNDAS